MLSRMLTRSPMLFRKVSNCGQPKARERKIVGAQKLAYQASCKEQEASHGGPNFLVFLKQVLPAGRQERCYELEMGI